MRAQLIKKFEDIPEVHTFSDIDRKMELRIPITAAEYIAFLEAQYHLWPDPRTHEILSERKNSDMSFE